MYVEEAAGFARRHDALLDLTLDEIQESRALVQTPGFGKVGNHAAQPRGRTTLAVRRMNKRERAAFHAPLTEILGGDPGRSIAVLLGGENDKGKTQTTPEYRKIRDAANEIVERERVLHWELRFPEVMSAGGFDAVIGNPPWDRIKLQEVEWWAARDENVAKARTAAERKSVVAARRATGDPVVSDFDAAAEQAAQFSTVIRKGGDYPLLGKGDIKPLQPVRRALDCAAQAIRSGRTADALGHLRRQDRRRILPFNLNDRSPRRHLRLRESPLGQSRRQDRQVVPRCPPAVQVLRHHHRRGRKRAFQEARCGFFLNSRADLEDEDRGFPALARRLREDQSKHGHCAHPAQPSGC